MKALTLPTARLRAARIASTLVAFALAATSCKGETASTAAPADPAAVTAAPAAAAPAAAEGSPEDCDAYAKSLCSMAGDQTGTCASINSVLKLLSPRACKAGLSDVEYSRSRIADSNKSCTELMTRLCKELGEETETCKMVRTKTPEFGAERCTKMLGDFDTVLGQLKQMEQSNKPLAPEALAAVTKAGAGEFGPADAKVTIVEFSDFQCPYCVRAAEATKKLKAKYGDKIRLIFRQYPLDFHKEAHLAAQAVLEARAQDKFWEMHDKLFENQKALGRADLETYAKDLGLDMAKFKAALDGGTHKATVDEDIKLGQSVGVQGTPTMLLNGAKVADPSNADAIGQQIEAALAAK